MVGKQLVFGDYEQSTTKKHANHRNILDGMEQVLPWLALIKPHFHMTESTISDTDASCSDVNSRGHASALYIGGSESIWPARLFKDYLAFVPRFRRAPGIMDKGIPGYNWIRFMGMASEPVHMYRYSLKGLVDELDTQPRERGWAPLPPEIRFSIN